MKENATIDYYLRFTWQQVTKMYNEEASKFNSTMVVAFVLLSLDPRKGVPSTTLGPKMGIEPTSLSRTLNNLEKEGLIERRKNPKDGRGVLISLTQDGLEMREESKQRVFAFNNAVKSKLGEEKLNDLIHSMKSINDIIKKNEIFHKIEFLDEKKNN